MEQLCFRNLVGVSHTEAEARALAEEVQERMLPYHLQIVQDLLCNFCSMSTLEKTMRKAILPLALES